MFKLFIVIDVVFFHILVIQRIFFISKFGISFYTTKYYFKAKMNLKLRMKLEIKITSIVSKQSPRLVYKLI